MQERKLLEIEHVGFWMAYWGLFIVMLVQSFIHPGDFRYFGGELIIFMGMCVYIGFRSAINGIWDRHLKMDSKTNLLLSLVAAIFVGLYNGFRSMTVFNDMFTAIMAGVISLLVTFSMIFIALSVSAGFTKKRFEKLEGCDEDEEND